MAGSVRWRWACRWGGVIILVGGPRSCVVGGLIGKSTGTGLNACVGRAPGPEGGGNIATVLNIGPCS